MITRNFIRQFLRIPQQGVSINLIKELRAITGSTISDCKKALESSNSDFEQAKEFLKQRGLVQAQKRLDKEAKEGVVALMSNQRKDFVVYAEVNCETDFVAKTDEFLTFSTNLIRQVQNNQEEINFEDKDQLQEYLKRPVRSQDIFQNSSIDEAQKLLIAKLQENVIVSKLTAIRASQNAVFGHYTHKCYSDSPCGLSGCIFELESSQSLSDGARQLLAEAAQNLAIQYLGTNPRFLRRNEVPQDELNEETQKVKATLGEKANLPHAAKIVEGKMKKFYEENVFSDMENILNQDKEQTIGQYIRDLEKELDSQITFKRVIKLSIK